MFKEYRSWFERQTNHKIKAIHSDGGGEYFGALDHFLNIEHIRTLPHSPQQNGVAERMNRTLVEMTRTLLQESKLPSSYWSLALKHATFIRNRVLGKNGIPHSILFGKKLYYRVSTPAGKLSSRSSTGVFVGFPDTSLSIYVLDGTGKLVRTDTFQVVKDKNAPTGPNSSYEDDPVVTVMKEKPKVRFTNETVSTAPDPEVTNSNSTDESAPKSSGDERGKIPKIRIPNFDYLKK